MLAIIDAFFRIALRRLGPEDLPDSGLLLAFSALAYLMLQAVIAAPLYGISGLLFGVLAADMLLLLVCLQALLQFVGKARRFRQTLTALLGTSALLTLFVLPFHYWWDSAAVAEPMPLLPGLGILFIVVWSVVVNGHIMARALSAPFGAGLLVSITYFFINQILLLQIRAPAA